MEKINYPFSYHSNIKEKVNTQRTSIRRSMPLLSEYIFCNLEIMKVQCSRGVFSGFLYFYCVVKYYSKRHHANSLDLFLNHFPPSPSDVSRYSEMILLFRPGVLIIVSDSITAD